MKHTFKDRSSMNHWILCQYPTETSNMLFSLANWVDDPKDGGFIVNEEVVFGENKRIAYANLTVEQENFK